MSVITLPTAAGGLEPFTWPDVAPVESAGTERNRVAYAAAHVVGRPGHPTAIDWDATLKIREHLWDCGLGVAEAMDTAQRGTELFWPQARELIRRTLDAARVRPEALVASGCGTDHLAPGPGATLDDVVAAYEEQMAYVEAHGGRVILMASRALASVARSADDYRAVYDRLLGQAREPVIIHWLGPMFDPALAGYWGADDVDAAMEVALSVIRAHAPRIDGIKISLLDKSKEIAMRRRLPDGVRMYTGDDFDFGELIGGDAAGHSDALLGIFDAIAPAAGAALHELAIGRRDRFDAILAPCIPLSRHVFGAPTRFYKTGVVFMAWLNGHQDHFAMLAGQESERSPAHLAEVFRLAAAGGLLRDPALAVDRMQTFCRTQGIVA
ncbi:MAG: dihydrodipicolinate synthase family protein [Acidobacteria bacterium]|nr:dihydrodipicolinate synthase family protein [Acidobacteriota bacterium]